MFEQDAVLDSKNRDGAELRLTAWVSPRDLQCSRPDGQAVTQRNVFSSGYSLAKRQVSVANGWKRVKTAEE